MNRSAASADITSRQTPIFYSGDEVRAVKQGKLRHHMDELGLDGLLVLRSEGIRYASDFYVKGYRRFLELEYCLVMDKAGGQSLGYTSGSDDIRLAIRSFLDDYRRLKGGVEDWHTTVAAMLVDHGLESGRVAYDFLPVQLSEGLKKLLPRLELVPASSFWEQVTAIKHPLEVAPMREAFRVVSAGISAGIASVEPGLREIDVAAEIEYAMRRAGNEMQPAITMVASGPNASIFERVATDRIIQPNEFVIMDVTGVVNGYSADAARTVLTGANASPEQEAIYSTCLAALKSATATARPGVRCGEVDAAARRVYADSEWAQYGSRFATGHQIGFGLHDRPLISEGSETELAAGMVICLEPRVLVSDRAEIGGVALEDGILVTDGEPEVLTGTLPFWGPAR